MLGRTPAANTPCADLVGDNRGEAVAVHIAAGSAEGSARAVGGRSFENGMLTPKLS